MDGVKGSNELENSALNKKIMVSKLHLSYRTFYSIFGVNRELKLL